MSRFVHHLNPNTVGLCPPGTLDPLDPELVAELREYKLKVAKRYRAVPPWLVDRAIPEGRLFISQKLDGELWFAVKRRGEVFLCAPNGRVIPDHPSGPPLTAELARQLADSPDDTLIAGELHVDVVGERGRARVFHVARTLRDPSKKDLVRFSAFDVVRHGEVTVASPYEDRLDLLERFFDKGRLAKVVTTFVETRDSVMGRYGEWVVSGDHEGLVCRHDNGQIYKVKPELELDAVVIAWSERLVEGRSEMRELQVALVRDEVDPERPEAAPVGRVFQLIGTVGTGFDERSRELYHARLSAMAAESSFRMANREGTLCRFVRPELIVTLKCSDVMAPDALEASSTRMALAFDGAWSQVRLVPSPSLIHPVFVRERPDKRVDPADVGLDQLRQVISFDEDLAPPPRAAQKSTLPPSTVIARRAWKKVTKGQVAVRKYVAWATHKRELDPSYPAYVACFTDYSPGRKDPLQRDLAVASTEDRLREHLTAWEADNIKRGWEEHR